MIIDDVFELDSYQFVVLAFNQFFIFTSLFNMVFNVFGAAQPTVLGCDGVFYNSTTKLERCSEYDADLSCRSPILQYEFYSVSVEFGQYCGRHSSTWMNYVLNLFQQSNKAQLSTTSQMVGIIFGAAAAGQLSDLYGRKRITCVFLMLMLVFSSLSSWSCSIDVYIIFRFFIGICSGGLNTVGSIFVVENLPAKHRVWLSTVVTWAPNYIIFALIAFFTQEWRLLARVCNVMTIVALVICIPFLPESPKFLVQARRREQAIKAIGYINKFKRRSNRLSENSIVKLVDEVLVENSQQQKGKYTFLDLYRHKELAVHTLVVSFCMLSVSYVTYALLFNYHAISGSIFLNTMFSGLMRYIVGAVVAVLDHFAGVGRKLMHLMTVSLIAICMFACFLIYVTGNAYEYQFMVRGLTLLAFGTTGCLFMQLLMVTSEAFPTGVRNLALAHVNICGRIGNIFGPMVFSYNIGLSGFPYLVLAVLGFIDVALFEYFIPETKGLPLPTQMPRRKSWAAAGASRPEEVELVGAKS